MLQVFITEVGLPKRWSNLKSRQQLIQSVYFSLHSVSNAHEISKKKCSILRQILLTLHTPSCEHVHTLYISLNMTDKGNESNCLFSFPAFLYFPV